MMFLFPFLLGLAAAIVGVAPPGLLNMTVAQLNVVEGKAKALFFSIGACVVVFLQTYLAVFFADFLDKNPEVIRILQSIGSVIFFGLSIYFFWLGKKKKIKKDKIQIKAKSRVSCFLLGILMSLLNVLPIPYYVFLSIWFTSKGWFSFTFQHMNAFALGALSGSFLIFYLYILFFKKKKDGSPSFFTTNGNYIIGTVTGFIALLTVFKIIFK
jgi:threonine/homoserine/homoserine lactone efflux protein